MGDQGDERQQQRDESECDHERDIGAQALPLRFTGA